MMMKKYTAKDLETFQRDEYGWLICPSGDYTAIKTFPEKCNFGMRCSFGRRCRFGKWSRFSEWSDFGHECVFGEGCIFGASCSFGEMCVFGKCSNFGVFCSFGEMCAFGICSNFGDVCSFGEGSCFGGRCNFGKQCSFGEYCCFGHNCSHEGLTNSIYMAVDKIGIELRKTYFFKAEEGYFVRAGCFFGTLDEFKNKVHKMHDGTIHETTYLMACDLAVKLLDSQWK